MILGIGCDLLDLTRLQSLLKRRGLSKFMNKILTDTERKVFSSKFPAVSCSSQSNVFTKCTLQQQEQIAKWLGVRWSVKESVYKVFNSLVLYWLCVCSVYICTTALQWMLLKILSLTSASELCQKREKSDRLLIQFSSHCRARRCHSDLDGWNAKFWVGMDRV